MRLFKFRLQLAHTDAGAWKLGRQPGRCNQGCVYSAGRKTPKPEQILFDVDTLSYPDAVILPLELFGLSAANESQLQRNDEIVQEGEVEPTVNEIAVEPVSATVNLPAAPVPIKRSSGLSGLIEQMTFGEITNGTMNYYIPSCAADVFVRRLPPSS